MKLIGMYGRIADNCCRGLGLSEVFSVSDLEKDRGAWECFRDRLVGKTLTQIRNENPSLLIFPHEFGCVKGIEKDSLISIAEKVVGEEKIVTGNLMGFIGYKGCSLSIASRFYPKGDDYFLHYMLARASGAHVVDLEFGSENDSVWDFLPYLFPRSLAEAWKQGVYRVNRRMEGNDCHVRGMIDISRHIRHNIPFQGKIAYSFTEKTINNPVNRLIRLTIDVLEGDCRYKPLFKSNDKVFCEAVKQIKQQIGLGDIAHRSKVIRENLRPVSHPLFLQYKGLQKLCLAILRHDKLTFGNESDTIHGIIFDGAWLWEEYLSRIMPPGMIHSDNRNGKNGKYALHGTQMWKWYPDFYREGDSAIVLDAKYKRFEEGIGTSDQHQVVSYMYILKARLGGFVHPFPMSDSNSDISYKEKTVAGFGGTVAKIGIPICIGAKNYVEFVSFMNKIESDFLKCKCFSE